MYKFSKRSLDRLRTCDPLLVRVCNDAMDKQIIDFTVLCGYRDNTEQDKLYAEGKSNARAGESKHNTYLSKAVDIAPYPIDWNNKERFRQLAEIMLEVAEAKSIKLVWGGNWKTIVDMPHFELED